MRKDYPSEEDVTNSAGNSQFEGVRDTTENSSGGAGQAVSVKKGGRGWSKVLGRRMGMRRVCAGPGKEVRCSRRRIRDDLGEGLTSITRKGKENPRKPHFCRFYRGKKGEGGGGSPLSTTKRKSLQRNKFGFVEKTNRSECEAGIPRKRRAKKRRTKLEKKKKKTN